MSFVEDSGTEDTSVETGAESTGPENQAPNLSPYAQTFLGGIEDANEKAILEKHIRNWDSGFTKQMQKHTQAVRQYQQFGPPDQVAKYAQIYQMLEADPQDFVQRLIDEGFYTPAQAKAIAAEVENENEFKLPPQLEEKLGKVDSVEKAVNMLLRSQQQQENIRRQQEEDAALDRATAALKKQYGDFPDQLVYTIAHANGGDLEGAVQTYKAMIQEEVNKRSTTQAPRIMSGSTLPPLERKASELSGKERRDRIALALSQMRD